MSNARDKIIKRIAVLLVVLFSWPTSVAALVLERITSFDRITNTDDLIVVDERLFYVELSSRFPGIVTEPPALMVTGGGQGTLRLAEDLQNAFDFTHIVEAGGLVYFLQEPFELWVTDGTPANTRLAINLRDTAPDISFITEFVANNDLVVLEILNSDDSRGVISTNGTFQGTVTFNPDESYRMDSLCVFNENNFIAQTTSRDSYSQFSNGAINTTALTGSGRFNFDAVSLADLSDACVYRVNDLQADGGPVEQLLQINQDGSQQLITVPDAVTQGRQLATRQFMDRLIVSRSDTSEFFTVRQARGEVFELRTESATLINTGIADLVPNGSSLLDIGFTDDTGYLLQFNNAPVSPPPPPFITRFDANYQPIAEAGFPVSGGSSASFADFALFDRQGEDFIFNKNAEEISAFSNFEQNRIRTSNVSINQFINQPGSANQAVFAIGTDRTVQRNDIYRFQTTPSVSMRLEGLWGSPEANSQGVQISTGIGSDRESQFLFMTILANSDNQAIWFGGSAPIPDGGSSIQVDLRLTSNLPFLGDNVSVVPNRTDVGTATITVTGCDTLDLDLQLIEPFGNRQLELLRVLDQSFSDLCTDG